MNYPVWYIPDIGGGTLIALIAIIHVFISHFAVGGGLYLVCAERKGLRENNPDIFAFTKKHAKFFLLMTLVMGGMTGVGIWFIISLVSPAATSILVHFFVFGWATEYVFFIVEIVAILIYFYYFGKMDAKTHLTIGLIYFASAWLSLFVITGIIGFMLTPGDWASTGNFWPALFNPSFWPALIFRSFISFMLAGVYAFITVSFLKDVRLKQTMTRFSAKWILASLMGAVPSGYWYLSVLPNQARALAEGASPTIQKTLQYGSWGAIVLVAGTLVLLVIRPAFHTKPVTFTVVAGALLCMGAFEWTREASRRPFVINEFMYSNSILKDDLQKINSSGFLRSAKWVSIREPDDSNLLAAGEEIFMHQCFPCHTVGGINNSISARTSAMDSVSLYNYIGKIHEIRYFMPPFAGNDGERKALAHFIIKGVNGKEVETTPPVSRESGGKGQELFAVACTVCHPVELVKKRTSGWNRDEIRGALDRLSSLNSAMPDYHGSSEEKEEMADYIHSLNSDKEGVQR